VAPECGIAARLRQRRDIVYVTADLRSDEVDVNLDVGRLPFVSAVFDAILCNHVLEHVPDDRSALRELRRVLRPGGWAILQVPVALALRQTLEDPSVTSASERLRRFGQEDHVRLYGPDYPDRIREAGLHVRPILFARGLGERVAGRYGLLRDETIFFCQRSDAIESLGTERNVT
jgi:SAM-dependent methyltransferase